MRGCVSTGATLIRFYRVVMRRKEEVRWDGGVPAGRRTNEPLTEGAEHLHWWDAHILQPDVGKDASVISPSATKCRSCRSSVRRSAVTWLDSQEHDGERGVQRGGDWEHEGGGRREEGGEDVFIDRSEPIRGSERTQMKTCKHTHRVCRDVHYCHTLSRRRVRCFHVCVLISWWLKCVSVSAVWTQMDVSHVCHSERCPAVFRGVCVNFVITSLIISIQNALIVLVNIYCVNL